jgi:hypothetical protein
MFRLKYNKPSSGPGLLISCICITTECLCYTMCIIIIIIINAMKINIAVNYNLISLVCVNFFGAFAELRKATIRFVMSVRLSHWPHGTTRLPPDGFP